MLRIPKLPQLPQLPQLLLLLSLLSAPAWSRAAPRTNSSSTEANMESQETTLFGDLNANTMTVAVDSDIILTTEDNIQQFTQLMDHVGTTTEEPLPESVLLQLEQEREEREGKRVDRTTIATTTTEGSANLKGNTTKPTMAGKSQSKTTKNYNIISFTTTTTTMMPTTNPGFRDLNNADYGLRLEGGMEAIGEQTTLSNFEPSNTPRIGDNVEGSPGMTTFIPQGEEFYSEAPIVDLFVSTEKPDLVREEHSSPNTVSVSMRPQQAEQNEFQSGMHLEQSTWFPDLAFLVESTLEPDMRIRTSETADDSSSTTELPNITTNMDVEETTTEIITELPKLLQMLDKSTTSTIPRLSTTTEVATTELPSTTSDDAEATTTLPATTTAAPTKLQQMVDTTSTTTPAPTEATTVAEMAEIVSTIAAPQQQAQPEAIATTIDLLELLTTEAATTTPAPPLPTTTTTSSSSSSSSSSSPPLQVVPLTRAPRVERIFNSDGVEVLYGYSSVVRTNHA